MRTSLATQLILLVVCCLATVTAVTYTRAQIYNQGGFVRNWVAPMPSSPIRASGVHNTQKKANGSGERFLVKNWGTTFHSIQIGADDISFIYDPFKATTATSSAKNVSTVMQLNYPKGSYAPAIGPVAGGTHFYAKPFGNQTSFSKMMVSYDVGFPKGFNWVLAGKLPGVYGGTPYDGCSGGVQSTGANCLTMRLMWRQNGIGEVYAYIPADAKSAFCKDSSVLCNDQYGKSIGRGQIYFQPGTWTRLDMVMELNEPAGKNNGTLQVYLNGNLAITLSNIPYRRSGMVGFQGLLFSSFFGGSEPTYATPVDTSVYFKNIQLSVGAPTTLYEGTGGSGAGPGVGAAWTLLSVLCAALTLLLCS